MTLVPQEQNRTGPKDHITVCICTYKRPTFLNNLLDKLIYQETGDLFHYSIVIVDNDMEKSSEETVSSFHEKNPLQIDWYFEPERNISLARNKSIKKAPGNYVALIDDDEFPSRSWLLNLYKTLKRYDADGVLGPVKPYFEYDPPEWIVKGKFCERPTYQTGTILQKDFRTGNVLLDIHIFDDEENYFDPKYGRSGGEDIDFFERIIKKGHVIIWCDEAPVYEYVPVERYKRLFYVKRYMRIGGIRGKEARESRDLKGKTGLFLKFIAVFFVCFSILPVSLLFGHQFFMKFLIKSAHHFAWIASFLGYVFIRHKED